MVMLISFTRTLPTDIRLHHSTHLFWPPIQIKIKQYGERCSQWTTTFLFELFSYMWLFFPSETGVKADGYLAEKFGEICRVVRPVTPFFSADSGNTVILIFEIFQLIHCHKLQKHILFHGHNFDKQTVHFPWVIQDNLQKSFRKTAWIRCKSIKHLFSADHGFNYYRQCNRFEMKVWKNYWQYNLYVFLKPFLPPVSAIRTSISPHHRVMVSVCASASSCLLCISGSSPCLYSELL